MKTPLEELRVWVYPEITHDTEMIDAHRLLAKIDELLTKEKEQREELIKEVCIKSYEAGFNKEYIGMYLNGDDYPKAEQYYNEVIKPKSK